MAIGAFCCIAIIAVGGMTAAVMNQVKDMTPCMFTNSFLASSLEEYVKEKGKYPPADKWQSELAPYYEKSAEKMREEMKDAPGMIKDWGNVASISGPMACQLSGTKTFISYNQEISGKATADVKDPKTIAFFEDTVEKMNASAVYKPKNFKDSPRMMGQPRGWYVVSVEGRALMVDEKGDTVEVDMKTGN